MKTEGEKRQHVTEKKWFGNRQSVGNIDIKLCNLFLIICFEIFFVLFFFN